ncbi:M4 family metallopeptidase [Streptomyces decoyicus]|uniref:M4 family metallopeptidase n=1 Tax=Streptomyces decoyicus TaxID=249567 RepID=UPI003626F3A5
MYQDQSGALNESFSDAFGSLVKQFARRQTGRAGGLADQCRGAAGRPRLADRQA